MRLAIVPALNEEKSIAAVIQKLKRHVDQVVVIDDNSTDATGRIAKKYGATVIRHLENRGVGAAMKIGVAYAKKLEPDITIMIDADGQHTPDDIPRLIKPIIEGKADFVLGSRFLGKHQVSMPFKKRIGNRILSLIVGFLVREKLSDTQTGFRALNKKALLSLNLVSDFTYTQEMILTLCFKGLQCVEVPIQVNSRKYGQSKVASDVINYALKSLASICFTYLRLKFGINLTNDC